MRSKIKNRTSKSQLKSNTVRIIAGKWRGSKLRFADGDGLRPSGDRSREVLFNWITPYLTGAHCLDIYAGSGCLAFEALSRGAQTAIVLDNNTEAIATIKSEAVRLNAEQLSAVYIDALSWLKQAPASFFDIVFVDPPFNSELLEPTITALAASGCLSDKALIYIETAKNKHLPTMPRSWQLIKSKNVGEVSLALFNVCASEASTNSESGI